MSLVGAKVLRKEDPNLITGRGQFVDDITPTGTAYLAFATSDVAHGRITSIDTSGADEVDGVLAVWTAADLEGMPPLDGPPGLERPVLATGKVRFAGEPYAVVVATSRAAAADAASAIYADIEALPANTSIDIALAEGAAPVDDNIPVNGIFAMPVEDPELDAALEAAPHTLSFQLSNNRCSAVPIEPNTVLADWSPAGLTMWATHQAPHKLRTDTARWFGVSQDTVRCIAPDVGGGFGAKINPAPELVLAPALSRHLGRPVKYTQTRSECMLNMYHGRAQQTDVQVGFDDEGNVLALKVHVFQDNGAYADAGGMGMPALTTAMAGGCYQIPKVGGGWTNVLTNATPIAAYRGAGRPEASFNIERTMDIVADELGMDPLEVRRRNFIPSDAFPYPTHSEVAVYDSGDYVASLDELLNIMDYDALKAEQPNGADPGKGNGTTSTGLPSGRYGMSSSGRIRAMTPLLPCRPAILSPTESLRFMATYTLTILMTPGARSSPFLSWPIFSS